MRDDERNLSKSSKAAYRAYKNWRKKEELLARGVYVYLENLRALYYEEKDVEKKIYELEENLKNFSLKEEANAESTVRIFLSPLKQIIGIDTTSLICKCRNLDNLKQIWKKNLEDACDALYFMQQNDMELRPRKCDMPLLIVLTYYYQQNKDYFADTTLIRNIIFSTREPYISFVEAFRDCNTAKNKFKKIWNEKIPKYLEKRAN